ncbi:3-isopropylmalate dehydrogenase [Desulfovibrio sp. OttesenSCG-928-I05]|nr:3-isopropylmalate dehydrogenase [Desulfovibrio sp. OttesenSCG-928-I05]
MAHVVFLPGDGIGPEVAGEAAKVLAAVAERYNLDISTENALIGGAAFDATGFPLPDETLALCKKADAVFLGAVGGPAWDAVPRPKRPEAGLLALRKGLGVFANLRPIAIFPELAAFSCLRQDIVTQGVDLLIVRELTGDIYFGEPRGEGVRGGLRYAYDTMVYDEEEIRRIARMAFAAARSRRKKVCSVDKANVLSASRLWRTVVEEEHAAWPDIELSHMYVDNAAMQLVARPASFDVILTGNLFGDILSDQAAAIAGSLGMLSSASLGATAPGLYEPAHGSAPDIAGQDKANPLASILSIALMLRMSLNAPQAADAVESAVKSLIREGFRTADLVAENNRNTVPTGCKETGDLIVARLK